MMVRSEGNVIALTVPVADQGTGLACLALLRVHALEKNALARQKRTQSFPDMIRCKHAQEVMQRCTSDISYLGLEC